MQRKNKRRRFHQETPLRDIYINHSPSSFLAHSFISSYKKFLLSVSNDAGGKSARRQFHQVRCVLGGARKMPRGRYTTEISDPGQRRSVLLGTFDTPKKLLGLTTGGEEVSRPHEVTNFTLDNLQNTRDFLGKLVCKKATTKE